MVVQRTKGRIRRRQVAQQKSLFAANLSSAIQRTGPALSCDVVAIEKRRDGGTRYWCRAHRADATAKYGKPASKCGAADSIAIRAEEVKTLDLDKYLGGVALWGAAPAVLIDYDLGAELHDRITRFAN